MFTKGHATNIGKKCSEETKRKIGLANRGRVMSDETKEKLRKAHTGMVVSQETKDKLRKLFLGRENKWCRGDKHPRWKGGPTEWSKKKRSSTQDKLWRRAVKERDGNRCVWCGSKDSLQADHIKSFSKYPEFRFAIDNGRTLCFTCHKKTKSYGRG